MSYSERIILQFSRQNSASFDIRGRVGLGQRQKFCHQDWRNSERSQAGWRVQRRTRFRGPTRYWRSGRSCRFDGAVKLRLWFALSRLSVVSQWQLSDSPSGLLVSELLQRKKIIVARWISFLKTVLFLSFHISQFKFKLIKAYMVCLGFKPGAAGWKVQTNPLSYGGTPYEIAFSKPILLTIASIQSSQTGDHSKWVFSG